jgi:hypothetical protein
MESHTIHKYVETWHSEEFPSRTHVKLLNP